MTEVLFLFYLLTAAVWLYRSKLAFEALRENPVVEVVGAGLKPAPTRTSAPTVSILVPAKNEEANLSACLQGLLAQDILSYEIIVSNDHSVDRTGEILAEFTRLYSERVCVVNPPPPPEGWTGKNWALAQGVNLAKGEWFLFTDADVRHEPWSVSSALAHAEARDLDLLTLTPRSLVESFWEKTLQASAMAYLGLWFPLARANDPHSKATFGNGQYFLIKKKTYEAIGGHEKVKGAFLEDYAMVREAKKAGVRVEAAMGQKIFGTRMYRSFSGIWQGWRRIYLHAFEKIPLRLLAKALSVILFSLFPFLCFPWLTQLAMQNPEAYGKIWGAGLVILSLILLTAWKAHSVVGAPRAYAFLHPLAGLILGGVLLDAFRIALQKKEVTWR